MRTIHFYAAPTLLLLSLSACGGSASPPQEPQVETRDTSDDYDPTSEIGATAEIGALPEEETIAAFRGSFEPIQECFINGAQRLEFLAGEIAFNVVVGSDGEVRQIFAERSTLGDRQTELCMFNALKRAPWPKPVGGLVGVAQNAFDFEMASDVRPPVVWEDFDVDAALGEQGTELNECKGSHRGRYTATVYVDTSGNALSAGISAPDKDAEEASDCLVRVLSEATYPSPGSWPAKVTFAL